jgi:signal transduction histidine kinase
MLGPMDKLLLGSRRTMAMTVALVLIVLAGVILFTTLQLRNGIRKQIAGRDGEVLDAVASMLFAEEIKEALTTEKGVADPLGVVLRTAQLPRAVLGVRIYDPAGKLLGTSPFVTEGELLSTSLNVMKQLKPESRFFSSIPISQLFYEEEDTTNIALLEINVPLHAEGEALAAVAQFLIEGQSVKNEFARLDRRLAVQSAAVFFCSAVILGAALGWSFRRLRRAHALVADRTQNLVRANQELALAAKTSALGSVTAHLIHGLKNPLAGLHSYVSARGSGTDTSEAAADWEQAVLSTRRMQAMVNHVISVLRDEQSGVAYEVTLAELEQVVCAEVKPIATHRGVLLASSIKAEADLPNRVSNLVAIILVNLIQNAIQATPTGKQVTLGIERRSTSIVFDVQDQGQGFPSDIEAFMPCRSSKEAGSGIGLAICRQLSTHLGAELSLAVNSPEGCLFRLVLPLGGNSSGELAVTESAGRLSATL